MYNIQTRYLVYLSLSYLSMLSKPSSMEGAWKIIRKGNRIGLCVRRGRACGPQRTAKLIPADSRNDPRLEPPLRGLWQHLSVGR